MYSSIPVYPLLYKAEIIPASTYLDYQQKLYAHCLLSFPDQYSAKGILLINWKERDEGFRPGELAEGSLM